MEERREPSTMETSATGKSSWRERARMASRRGPFGRGSKRRKRGMMKRGDIQVIRSEKRAKVPQAAAGAQESVSKSQMMRASSGRPMMASSRMVLI